jgi:hypothetical protein
VQPNFIAGLSYTEVALWAGVDYTCLDPYFETLWFGIPLANFVQAVIPFHNGSQFTVTFTPPPDGPSGPMSLVAQCSVGPWVRGPDLNFYDVRLGIGWALELPDGRGIEALSAPIGTVEARH